MEEKITPCECPLSQYGIYCNRHKINKTPHFQKLCRTRQDYFDMYENCSGPGQEFTNCDGESNVVIPIEVKEPCPSCEAHKKESVALPGPPELPKRQEVKLPSMWQQAKNLTKAVVKHVATGAKEVSPEVYEERISTCKGCEYFIESQNRCKKCGCHLLTKCRWKTSACPIGLWKAVD